MNEFKHEWWFQRVTELHAFEFNMICIDLVEFLSIPVSSASTEAARFALYEAWFKA